MKVGNNFLKTISRILFLGLLAMGIHASAQQAQTHGKDSMTPEQRIDMRVNKMKQNLNLTDDQVVKMKQLFMRKQSEYSANSSNQQAKAEERKEMKEEMAKILTPEQMAKMKEEMKEMHRTQKEKGSSDYK